MKTFALSVLDLLDRSAVSYGDVRVVRQRSESFRMKNGVIEAWSDEEGLGFGVRLLIDGFWGFAAANELTRSQAERTVAEAVSIALSSASVGGPKATLAPVRSYTAEYESPCLEDPFAVSAEDKIDFLRRATEPLSIPDVSYAIGRLGAMREEKVFASTEGSLITQSFTCTGGGISATALREGNVQTRSYPSAEPGSFQQGGFEVVRSYRLGERAPALADEAVALLSAPACPADVTTVILDSDQMILQVHESVGHPTELDRIFGSEASYAGTSFLSPDDLGRFRYGSGEVNISADATVPGGLGTAAYDDEGVPAANYPLVSAGLLTGFLTSRETAAQVGQESTGAMRASGWNRIPLIRMTNINLLPGSWRLEDLVEDTAEGIFMSTNRSWSIDDQRLNFHFGTEIGWEIRNGRLGRMLRDCAYTGTTPLFWASCDAVCDQEHWRLFGVTNCGKGEPGQTISVGHGASPARFRGVKVGRAG